MSKILFEYQNLFKYDIVKRMERMGKSVGMLTGQAEPTIIQPPMYKKRFKAAMERYFMTVPVSTERITYSDFHSNSLFFLFLMSVTYLSRNCILRDYL